ncbi:MAG: hypothetical protein B7Z44_05410 [Caulobacter sp. 12-67-6]|nr:MAG: hypothetical protein B7Z44_05410 [Caulobacter sp. 12-67-6]OYX68986.1 MAG: hypothetical protein B7Y81_15685 [Caulobacter sp. 32-67-35]
MTDRLMMNRRRVLASAAGLGLSVTFLGRPALADTDGALDKRKLVVVICRGGMDGLSVSPPVGDADYQGLRRGIAFKPEDVLKLDGTFGLHPALTSVHALALKGQARIAPAVATPDRARSHFEAQDVLESGSAQVYATTSGWLNRALEALPASRKAQGLYVGATTPLILRGKVQAASWSPGKGVDETARLPTLLQDLYKTDPLMGPAFARGLETESMAQVAMTAMATPVEPLVAAGGMAAPGMMAASAVGRGGRAGRDAARKLGATLAGFMVQDGGPRIAALSLDGWDTHAGQVGQINTRLTYLDAVLSGLNTGLGDEWKNTVVVTVTEFGRTARANGTGGTDHGTASTALVLGGALKPGGIIGDWPGLAQPALYENRDLAPTLDMRGLFKGLLGDHMGLDRAALESRVFANSAEARAVTGLV